MILPKYNNRQADKMASQFFRHTYHDRGMLKWQGYFLSDHTAALHRHRQLLRRQRIAPPTQQSPLVISYRLTSAWQSKQPVIVILNAINGNRRYTSCRGIVLGYHDDQVIIQTKSHQTRFFSLTMIRSVTLQ